MKTQLGPLLALQGLQVSLPSPQWVMGLMYDVQASLATRLFGSDAHSRAQTLKNRHVHIRWV